jgi:hypothetical protein
VLGSEVNELGALPLKYFGLFNGHAPHGAGRGRRLAAIRATARAELNHDPGRVPNALAERAMPWYELIVAPVINAVVTATPLSAILNCADADGVVREHAVRVAGPSFTAQDGPSPPATLAPWLDRFERHERAVLAAVAHPGPESIRAACEVDPLLPPERADPAVAALTATLQPVPVR